MLEEKQIKLANDLLNYELEFEHYELKNKYENESQAFNHILEVLQSEKGLKTIINYLKDDVENFRFLLNKDPDDFRNKEMYEKSLKIFKNVIKYKREFKKLEIRSVV